MNNRHFQLITFDLDDTLWPVAPVIRKAEETSWNWLRDYFPRIQERYSLDDMMALRMQLMRNDHLRHRISAVRVQAVSQALRRSGYLPAVAERGAHDAFDVFLHARHEVAFFENAVQVLEALAEHYTLGVLTNGNACVHRLGLGHLFAFAYAAEHFHASKPDTLMFQAALDNTACPPDKAIHVGDHPEYDIAPAQAIGMRTVWVNTEARPWADQPAPDREARTLQDLLAAVEALESEAA